MNAAKPPPPPPQRPGASRPPTPPPARVGTSTGPPAPGGSSSAPPPMVSTRPAPLAASRPPVAPAAPELPARQRVSVKASVRDARLFLARPLADGEAPPPGTREAFLVMAEPEIDVEPEAAEPQASNGGPTP
jgi:hypothetical protein